MLQYMLQYIAGKYIKVNSKQTAGWTDWKHCNEMKTRLSVWWLVVIKVLGVVIFFLFSLGKKEKFCHVFLSSHLRFT